MRHRVFAFCALTLLAMAALVLSSLPSELSYAQAPNVSGQGPAAGRGARGRGARGANAAASLPAPRNAAGRVILGPPPGGKGFWGSGGSIYGRGGGNLTLEQIPFQPWARALFDLRQKEGGRTDPHVWCFPPGGPRQFQTPNGFEFIEQPEYKRIFVVFGGGPRSWRVIYTDGRPLPNVNDPDLLPTYFGYSTGHWEGDTLVIESAGYNERFWFHRGGLPHTRFLHFTEKFSRPDYDTLKYEVTVDDIGAYTKPWTGSFTVPWTYTNWDGSPGGEITEYLCQDNERDSQHFVR